ncbi:PepSY-associated TM helix domain-containing protein, partial [Bradyrhizobium sp. Mp27]
RRLFFVIFAPDSQQESSPLSGRKSTQATVRICGASSDRYLAEQLWIHNGAAFGLIGRLLVFAAGFAPLALFISGAIMWLKKRPARIKTGWRA